MMRKLSKRHSSSNSSIRTLAHGDLWHHDIMAYLGSMNTSMALLAFLRLYAIFAPSKALSTGTAKGDLPLDITALLVLGLANFSQAYMNFWTGSTADRWIMGKGFDRITVLDALFTVLDWMTALKKLSQL
ncbi:hypothetical protein HJFPF1_07405 [Paramyrothecium foliicola]|nr:hypothetical protein HJFPF1_07405 [Paramyrothecium foliicola]